MKARIFAAGRPLLQNHDWPLGVECAWPAALQPVRTVQGAAYRPRWLTRLLRTVALIAFAVALWQLGQGSYIQAKAWLAQPPGETRLTLITCYPFDALRTGGPLRYVVTAKAI